MPGNYPKQLLPAVHILNAYFNLIIFPFKFSLF